MSLIQNRDINDCKKKWHDISCATKKKEASRRKEMRATGGGPAPPDDLKAWERLVSIMYNLKGLSLFILSMFDILIT